MTPETARYLKRNVEHFKQSVPPADWIELDPFAGNDNPVIRAYVETAMGRTTHRSRSRIKSALYNWKRIDAWMTEHRMSNSDFVVVFKMKYGRKISVGTIANIRSGHYSGKPMIEKVENLIAQCERGRE
jgi:hypothetical protein